MYNIMNIISCNCSTGGDLLIFFTDFSLCREGKLVGRINEKEVKEAVLGYLEGEEIMTGKKALFSKSKCGCLISI